MKCIRWRLTPSVCVSKGGQQTGGNGTNAAAGKRGIVIRLWRELIETQISATCAEPETQTKRYLMKNFRMTFMIFDRRFC